MALSRLPLDYRAYARAGLFRHGRMDQDDYALGVLQWHLSQASLTDLNGQVCLELGPGDAVSSALVAHALGAERCYLIDVGAFANEDMGLYRAQARALEEAGYRVPDVASCADLQALLRFVTVNPPGNEGPAAAYLVSRLDDAGIAAQTLECEGRPNRVNGVYLTEGLASLRSIGTDSIDFAWSQAVLEHVRLAQFDQTLFELHRALRPSAMASHRVDLQDHLAGSLHNLRFRRATWEQDWFAASGFYTNRIRHADMVNRFKAAGFRVEVTGVDRWPRPPLAKQKLDREFAALSDDELRISGFDVVLRA